MSQRFPRESEETWRDRVAELDLRKRLDSESDEDFVKRLVAIELLKSQRMDLRKNEETNAHRLTSLQQEDSSLRSSRNIHGFILQS